MGDLIGAWFERDVVRVGGSDAARYLQGQLSQDVEGLAVGAAAWSLLLDPAGKLVAWPRVRRVGDTEFLLDVAAGWSEVLIARLNRFRIRVDVEIEEQPGHRMFSVRGPGSPAIAADDPEALPAPGLTIGVEGFDLVGLDPAAPDGVRIDADAVEEFRIGYGLPEAGAELDETVIAAEIGVWFVEEAVSWTKGCYTGQELVARVDSRGSNTPRRLRALGLAGPASPGDRLVDADGKDVGEVTSVFGDRALARVARSVVPPAEVTVGGAPASVTEIPGTTPPPPVVTDEGTSRRRSLI